MNKISKKKLLSATIIIAACIMLAGTFAWFTYNQRIQNVFTIEAIRNVNLHDDFDDPNKDVYVENGGRHDIYLRVRLAEFLEMNGAAVFPYTDRNDTDTWLPHTYTSAETTPGSEIYNYFVGDCGEEFHEYHQWFMGGQKFYMPATEEERGDGDTEPVVVQNTVDYEAKLREYFAGDAATLSAIDAFIGGIANDAQKQALSAAISAIDENNADGLHLVKMTQGAKVISMEQWVNGDAREQIAKKSTGKFWVVDKDGWCYWAEALKPGEATGLLLDKVVYTNDEIVEQYYAIEAWLQAVTADGDGIYQFGFGNMRITEEATLLLELATGNFVLSDDGSTKYFIFKANGKPTNAYCVVNENNLRGPVFSAGDDQIPGTPDDITADANIKYNIILPGDTEATELTVKEIVIGENGKAYFKMEDADGNTVYFGDAPNGGTGQLFAPDSLLGSGTIIWAGADALIGTADDTAQNPWITSAVGDWYYNAGGNVYYKVSERMSSIPLETRNDKPVLICAGRDSVIGTSDDIIYGGNGFYTMYDGSSAQTYINGVLNEAAIYDIVNGADGVMYFHLLEIMDGSYMPGSSYISAGADRLLGTSDDTLLSAGADDIIGTNDDTAENLNEAEVTIPYGYDEADID